MYNQFDKRGAGSDPMKTVKSERQTSITGCPIPAERYGSQFEVIRGGYYPPPSPSPLEEKIKRKRSMKVVLAKGSKR